jgi:hypothetical protein
MNATQYHASKATPLNLKGAVSKSLLWDFYQSPFKWRHSHPKPVSPAMTLGSLVHALCFTPEALETEYAVSPYDSFRTNEAKTWKADMELAGRKVITQDQHEEASAIADCVMNTDLLFRFGERDYEVQVEAEMLGVTVKGMIDIAPKHTRSLADLKTTSSIGDINNLQRTIINRGYHWQAALYLDLWNTTTGEDKDEFEFIFVETAHPYEWAEVKLSGKLIDVGRNAYMNALKLWVKCVENNHFPRSIEGIQVIDCPFWAE